MAEAWISLAPDLSATRFDLTKRAGHSPAPCRHFACLTGYESCRPLSLMAWDWVVVRALCLLVGGRCNLKEDVAPRLQRSRNRDADGSMDGANIYHRFHRSPRGAQIGVWEFPAEQGSKLPWLALASRQPSCDVGCRGMNLDRLSRESY